MKALFLYRHNCFNICSMKILLKKKESPFTFKDTAPLTHSIAVIVFFTWFIVLYGNQTSPSSHSITSSFSSGTNEWNCLILNRLATNTVRILSLEAYGIYVHYGKLSQLQHCGEMSQNQSIQESLLNPFHIRRRSCLYTICTLACGTCNGSLCLEMLDGTEKDSLALLQ